MAVPASNSKWTLDHICKIKHGKCHSCSSHRKQKYVLCYWQAAQGTFPSRAVASLLDARGRAWSVWCYGFGVVFFVCLAFRFLVRVAVVSRTSPQSVTELILITSETCPAPLLAQLQLPLADMGIAASSREQLLGPGSVLQRAAANNWGALKTKHKKTNTLFRCLSEHS